MEDLLKSLADAGIKTDCGKSPDISAESSYRGSFGFFHVHSSGWSLIFVKGVYKGHIRLLEGKPSIEDKKLNELAQILADSERCLRHPADLRLNFDGEHFHVVSAVKSIQPFIQRDCRDRHIPEPLTPVEASLGKHSGINDRHLFAKSPFGGVFGETLSPFAFSITEMMPDLMNPLFMGSSIKTYSPSIKPFFGRIYLNISNADVITSAFKTSPDFFYMNFLPSVYKTLKKPTADVPDLSVLKLKDEETDASIEDIELSAEALTTEEMLKDSFFELPALCVMTWEMAYLKMWQAFTEILRFTKDTETAMRHAYCTRKGGLIASDAEVMPLFDPAYAPVRLNPVIYDTASAGDFYKSLPQTKRLMMSRAKYDEKLAAMHLAMDRMDRTYLALSKLAQKVRSLLLETADSLIDKNIITDKNDIFYLEYKEIRNIVNDEFYGNIPFTLNFRKWQNHRHGVLCLPPYLYEKDVESVFDITSRQIEKSENEAQIPCLSFFHKGMKTANFICSGSFSIADVGGLDEYDAVIAESASIFSYAAQYCTVKAKPLYTGARFAALLTKNKTIETDKDCIRI